MRITGRESGGRRTIFTDTMEVFHRAADLIGLDHRTRLEFEEPDFEHIFYLTVPLRDRLIPVPDADAPQLASIPETILRDPNALEPLPDGTWIVRNKLLLNSDLSLRNGALRIQGLGAFRIEPGQPKRFKAYRVQFSNTRGPYHGGVRYHREVSIDRFKCLAALSTWNSAVANVPFGGAMGGIRLDPRLYGQEELQQITLRYMYKVHSLIGPSRDILSPDMGTGPETMAWLVRQLCDTDKTNLESRSAVTGKDPRIGGSCGNDRATALGLAWCLDERLSHRQDSLRGKTFLLQGFGKIGSGVAEILTQHGCRPLAIGDAEGALFNPDGIDVDALFRYVFENPANLKKTIVGFPQAEAISKKDFFELSADMLILAALGGELTPEIAEKLKVGLIVEAANAATVPEAEEILRARRIEVIPDILANCGGVLVSYYEWLQNRHGEQWPEYDVHSRLERDVRSAYRIVRDIAQNSPGRSELHNSSGLTVGKEVDTRLASMILALKRLEARLSIEGFST